MSISSNTTRGGFKAGARKRLPTHPADVIAEAMAALGQNNNQVALATGMSRSGLGLVLNKKRPVSPDTALLISTYFGMGEGGARMLMGLQIDYDLWEAQAKLRDKLKQIVPAKRPRRPRAKVAS